MEYDPLYLTEYEIAEAGIQTAEAIWKKLSSDVEEGLLWVADLQWTGDADFQFKAATLLKLMTEYDAFDVVAGLERLIQNLKIKGVMENDQDLLDLADEILEMAEKVDLRLKLPSRITIPLMYEYRPTDDGGEWEVITQTHIVFFN